MSAEKMTDAVTRTRAPSGSFLSVVSIALDAESHEHLKSLMQTVQMAHLRSELSRYYEEVEGASLLDILKDLQPDICLVDFDRDREKASLTAEKIHERFPQVALFAVSRHAQSDFVIHAMRSGCVEYLVKPVNRDELLEAVSRVAARRKGKTQVGLGRIIALLGAKGGSGVTTLSIYLAALLKSAQNQKTLLIDYHSDLGDAALFLSLEKHPYNFYDLAENTHRLDPELLQGFLAHHSSGLDVLTAPEAFGTHRPTTADSVGLTLEFLRSQYQFVVVDCPPGLNEQNLAVVQHADLVYLIATPELPAVRNLARYLEQLTRYHFPPERVRVVINRHSKRDSVPVEEVEKTIRRKVDGKIPNQYAEVVKAINLGAVAARASGTEFLRSLNAWSASLAGKPAPETKRESKGILGLWN